MAIRGRNAPGLSLADRRASSAPLRQQSARGGCCVARFTDVTARYRASGVKETLTLWTRPGDMGIHVVRLAYDETAAARAYDKKLAPFGRTLSA